MNTLLRTKSVMNHILVNSGLESRFIQVISAEPGRVELELAIQKEHTNRLEILHGGIIASLVDLGGTLAIASRGLSETGVTTDLNVSYLKSGGRVGDVVKAIASLAYTNIVLKNGNGEITARGSHTKFLTEASRLNH
ncbi:hypothetical protein HI914_02128 [Erysiphe necator]|nr:hypothetical protein HI914_02128 [Erysiphe necator]